MLASRGFISRNISLYLPSPFLGIKAGERRLVLTSRRVTGFSSKDKCVSLVKFLRASRSASSAKLLDVRIRVVRFGIEAERFGCILLTRLRASRRVFRRGESGKLERAVISLSVKSIASWSYAQNSTEVLVSI